MKNVGVYESKDLVFYMYPKKIVVSTRLQSFRIIYDDYKHRRIMDRLKVEIISGRVNTIPDIADYCENNLVWENCGNVPKLWT